MTRAEPVALVKQTIASLLAIKSPNDEILVVDNNHSNTLLYKPLANYCDGLDASLKVRFYHKDAIAGYKAGALNFALSQMDANCDYIVVVDSDYQALPWARTSIVKATHRYPEHALLQFPQYYRDANKADIHAELNHYFSHHLMQQHNRCQSLSTGTYAVIKKQALVEVGGWGHESLTEDAQMGVLLHLKGMCSNYIPEVIATGVLPQTMADLVAQRRRWIYGNMQVLINYPKLLITQWLGRNHSIAVASSTLKTETKINHPKKTLNIAQIRAHLSQLSAWVNFTGVFIIGQGGCVLMLLTAKIAPNASLSHTLTNTVLYLLAGCYLGYSVFMGRRLWAYLHDTRPLLTPYGVTLNTLQHTMPHTIQGRQNRPSTRDKAAIQQSFKAVFAPSIQSNTASTTMSNRKPTYSEAYKTYKPVDNTQHITKASSQGSKVRGSKSVRRFGHGMSSLWQTIKSHLPKAKGQAQQLTILVSKWRQQNSPIVKTAASNQHCDRYNSQHYNQPHNHYRYHYPADAKPRVTPVSARLRAWLLHMSFWELGALSWLPVIWGQQKPFVCTPKLAVTQKRSNPWLTTLMGGPKTLLLLNIATAILVSRHSPLLLACALTIVVIKLLSAWVVIQNYADNMDDSGYATSTHTTQAVQVPNPNFGANSEQTDTVDSDSSEVA